MMSERRSKLKIRPRKKMTKLEVAEDVAKTLLQWIFVTACSFAYWMLVLFLFSIFLLNIWHTSIEDLLRYGIILTIITSIVYAGIIIWRKLH